MFIGNLNEAKVYVYGGSVDIPDIIVFPYRVIVKAGTKAHYDILKVIT